MLDQWPSTKREILLALKRNDQMTVNELSDRIGVTHMAIRKHLDGLLGSRLIEVETVRQRKGRPLCVYRLTPKGHDLFPRGHKNLLKDMLEHVRSQYGEGELDRFFRKRFQRLKQRYGRRMTGKALSQRMKELADIREKEGYFCRWKAKGNATFTLVEHHCPLSDVARECPQICQYEQKLLEQLLDAEVEREDHIASGGSQCRYHIRAHTSRKGKDET